MAEYIEREAALHAIFGEPTESHYPSWYAERIKALPAADVAPVRNGVWVREIERTGNYSHCSECGCRCAGYTPNYKYCPNCGAKMDLEG